jgi:hypothetical protein
MKKLLIVWIFVFLALLSVVSACIDAWAITQKLRKNNKRKDAE